MAQNVPFQCEVQKSKDKDESGNEVKTVRCHGRLVSDTAGTLTETVKPLIPLGGRILIDLSDVSYLDSSGMGALVGLKVSAIRQGLCRVELVEVTPRVLELLRITKLAQIFSS
jgi:anti-anti-sigma factor